VSKPKPVSSLLTFKVGQFRFCVDAVDAEAIIEAPEITTVPMAPKSIAGVFSYRGSVVVVVNLRRKFGLPEPSKKLSGQIILSRIEEELKGFLVDDVLDILENVDLEWQALPLLGTSGISSHTVLKDDAIFLHTDFIRLFTVSESEDLGSLLISMVGGEQTEEPAETHPNLDRTANLKAQDLQTTDDKETKSCRQKARAKDAATNDHQDVINTFPAKTVVPKISALNTTDAIMVQQRRTGNKPKDQALKPPKRRITAAVKSATGSTARPTTGGNNIQHPGTSRRTPPAGNLKYNQQDVRRRSDESAAWWPKLAAGLLFVIITTAFTAWFWPQDGLSLEPNARAQVSKKDIAPVEVPKTKIIAAPEDNGSQKPTFKTSAKISKATEEDSIITISVAAIEKAIDRQPDSNSEATANDELVSLPQKDRAPTPSPAAIGRTKEILRVDTEDFTLTIERPEPSLKNEAVNNTLAKWTTDESIHIVVRGDTLWDIAKHFLGDPFRYPELAKLSHINDPHWIYPGDVIRIVRKKPSIHSFS
jgi:purine-binding chemotaxis protein CheW